MTSSASQLLTLSVSSSLASPKFFRFFHLAERAGNAAAASFIAALADAHHIDPVWMPNSLAQQHPTVGVACKRALARERAKHCLDLLFKLEQDLIVCGAALLLSHAPYYLSSVPATARSFALPLLPRGHPYTSVALPIARLTAYGSSTLVSDVSSRMRTAYDTSIQNALRKYPAFATPVPAPTTRNVARPRLRQQCPSAPQAPHLYRDLFDAAVDAMQSAFASVRPDDRRQQCRTIVWGVEVAAADLELLNKGPGFVPRPDSLTELVNSIAAAGEIADARTDVDFIELWRTIHGTSRIWIDNLSPNERTALCRIRANKELAVILDDRSRSFHVAAAADVQTAIERTFTKGVIESTYNITTQERAEAAMMQAARLVRHACPKASIRPDDKFAVPTLALTVKSQKVAPSLLGGRPLDAPLRFIVDLSSAPTSKTPADGKQFLEDLSRLDPFNCAQGGTALSAFLRAARAPSGTCLVRADAERFYDTIRLEQAMEALKRQAARLKLPPPTAFERGWNSVRDVVAAAFLEGQMYVGRRGYGHLNGLAMGGALCASIAKVVVLDALHRAIDACSVAAVPVFMAGAFVDDAFALTPAPDEFIRVLRDVDGRVKWADTEVLRPSPSGSDIMRILDCSIRAISAGDHVDFAVAVHTKERPPTLSTTFQPLRFKSAVSRALIYRALRMAHSKQALLAALSHAARMTALQGLRLSDLMFQLRTCWATNAGAMCAHAAPAPIILGAAHRCKPVSSALPDGAEVRSRDRWRTLPFLGRECTVRDVTTMLQGGAPTLRIGWRRATRLQDLVCFKLRPPGGTLLASWSVYRIVAPDGAYGIGVVRARQLHNRVREHADAIRRGADATYAGHGFDPLTQVTVLHRNFTFSRLALETVEACYHQAAGADEVIVTQRSITADESIVRAFVHAKARRFGATSARRQLQRGAPLSSSVPAVTPSITHSPPLAVDPTSGLPPSLAPTFIAAVLAHLDDPLAAPSPTLPVATVPLRGDGPMLRRNADDADGQPAGETGTDVPDHGDAAGASTPRGHAPLEPIVPGTPLAGARSAAPIPPTAGRIIRFRTAVRAGSAPAPPRASVTAVPTRRENSPTPATRHARELPPTGADAETVLAQPTATTRLGWSAESPSADAHVQQMNPPQKVARAGSESTWLVQRDHANAIRARLAEVVRADSMTVLAFAEALRNEVQHSALANGLRNWIAETFGDAARDLRARPSSYTGCAQLLTAMPQADVLDFIQTSWPDPTDQEFASALRRLLQQYQIIDEPVPPLRSCLRAQPSIPPAPSHAMPTLPTPSATKQTASGVAATGAPVSVARLSAAQSAPLTSEPTSRRSDAVPLSASASPPSVAAPVRETAHSSASLLSVSAVRPTVTLPLARPVQLPHTVTSAAMPVDVPSHDAHATPSPAPRERPQTASASPAPPAAAARASNTSVQPMRSVWSGWAGHNVVCIPTCDGCAAARLGACPLHAAFARNATTARLFPAARYTGPDAITRYCEALRVAETTRRGEAGNSSRDERFFARLARAGLVEHDLGVGGAAGAQWCARLALAETLYGDGGRHCERVNAEVWTEALRAPVAAWPSAAMRARWLTDHADTAERRHAADEPWWGAAASRYGLTIAFIHDLEPDLPILIGTGPTFILLGWRNKSHFVVLLPQGVPAPELSAEADPFPLRYGDRESRARTPSRGRLSSQSPSASRGQRRDRRRSTSAVSAEMSGTVGCTQTAGPRTPQRQGMNAHIGGPSPVSNVPVRTGCSVPLAVSAPVTSGSMLTDGELPGTRGSRGRGGRRAGRGGRGVILEPAADVQKAPVWPRCLFCKKEAPARTMQRGYCVACAS